MTVRWLEMASKHTPGPWLVPHFARPDIQCNCGYVLSPNYMGAIATVHFEGEKPGEYDDNPPLDEAIANARLIAATPDMLAALVSVRDWDEHDANPAGYGGLRHELREVVDAAIAKAEGR